MHIYSSIVENSTTADCPEPLTGGQSIGGTSSLAPVPAGELILLAAATGLAPRGGWQAAGLSTRLLRQLKQTEAGRFNELRQLAVLGGLYPAPLLTDLLKARLAQRLLATDNAAELERLAKIIERLPCDSVGQTSVPIAGSSTAGERAKPGSAATRTTGEPPVPLADPDADVDSMELAEALAEAKRLIAELEQEDQEEADG